MITEWSAATYVLVPTFFPILKSEEIKKKTIKCTFCKNRVLKENCKSYEIDGYDYKRFICYGCAETYTGKYILRDY